MAALVRSRLLGHPRRLATAIPIFLVSGTAHPRATLRARMNRKLVELALEGMDEDDYSWLAAQTGRALASKAGFALGPAIVLCKHAAGLTRTIVITASERRLARSFLDAVGLNHVELQASELQFLKGTVRLSAHNIGPAKLRKLGMIGVDCAEATFYTDSASDLPLAAAAGTTILVNPDTRSRRTLEAALPNVKTIRW